MKYALTAPIHAAELADILELPIEGPNILVSHVAGLNSLVAGCFGFSTKADASVVEGSVVVATEVLLGGGTILRSQNPRLDFIHALRWLEVRGRLCSSASGHVNPDAIIDPTAIVEPGASISAGCHVGPFSHIRSHVTLGRDARIGSGCVIGHDGFGIERDTQGRAMRFPHLGGVVIEEGVDIGQLCVVARGCLEDTRIGAGVKIDDQSYIAHNVVVGPDTLLMSGSRLNGRVRVGARCWIGTGALIREGIAVGDDAVIGMGSVVTKDVAANTTVFGNPARLRENAQPSRRAT